MGVQIWKDQGVVVTDNSWKMKMKILAAFLLAVLGWSFTEGRIVSKCELRDQLKNATANLTMPNGLTVDNVVATIVCQAEQASHLNTSAENQQKSHENEGGRSGERKNHRRWRRHDNQPSSSTHPPPKNCTSGVCQEGLPSGLNTTAENHQESSENEDSSSEENDERRNHRRWRRHDNQPSSSTHPPPQNCTSGVCQEGLPSGLNTTAENHQESSENEDSSSEENDERRNHRRWRRHDNRHPSSKKPSTHTIPAQNCVLYGIFQLSSCQACNNSITPTANVCGISCSNLLDDDIQDDINCLLKILATHGDHDRLGTELEDSEERIWKDGKCEDVKATVYFSGVQC
ncbi:uncharacterized protein LOC113162252 [Anabas testudineus]|uniref:uncharacterized protein LOC113162252 n=1 Tax=Anabas testudineus TaxID=64144 RepID=UPI000E45A407|nr:uncharacterized protein LOC113162252 [Anabas testudineus]